MFVCPCNSTLTRARSRYSLIYHCSRNSGISLVRSFREHYQSKQVYIFKVILEVAKKRKPNDKKKFQDFPHITRHVFSQLLNLSSNVDITAYQFRAVGFVLNIAQSI